MWAYKPDAEDWFDRKREEWRKHRQLERELFKRQLALARAQLLAEEERDKEIRKTLSDLTLTPEHRQKLYARGLTDEQIEAGGYRSVTQWQKLSIKVNAPRSGSLRDRLAGVKKGGRSLLTSDSGIICPVPNEKGQFVAWQLRLDNPDDDNKYLWAAGARSRTPRPTSHLQNGELPLALYQPATVKKAGVVGLTEGIGFKPHIASENLGIPVIGAAGGNFASSSQTLKAYLEYLSSIEVIFYPDAGVLVNKQVLNASVKTIELTFRLN